MARTPEVVVKDQVKAALSARRVVPFSDILSGRAKAGEYDGFYYMPVAGRFAVLGVHDFVGCLRGHFFSIETKAPDNPDDATAHQEKFQEASTATGGISFTGARDASVVDALFARVEELEARCAHDV